MQKPAQIHQFNQSDVLFLWRWEQGLSSELLQRTHNLLYNLHNLLPFTCCTPSVLIPTDPCAAECTDASPRQTSGEVFLGETLTVGKGLKAFSYSAKMKCGLGLQNSSAW